MQAEVPDLVEARWQDVLQEPANELHRLESNGADLVGLAIPISHYDLSVTVSKVEQPKPRQIEVKVS